LQIKSQNYCKRRLFFNLIFRGIHKALPRWTRQGRKRRRFE
jgi:hypothetical protein